MSRPLLSVGKGRTSTVRILPGAVRISTCRLVELGFEADAVVSVSAEPASLTFALCENGVERYRELVRLARRNKTQLIQVRRIRKWLSMEITGALVNRAGFKQGEALSISVSHGLIQLQRSMS